MVRSWVSSAKFLTITGVGQFADGYLNTTIGLVVPMLAYVYFQDANYKIPTISNNIMKGGLSIGMILGQVMFGVFGDAFGRHAIYGRELMLTMVGTLLVITAPPQLGHGGIVAWVAVFRVVTGFGVGGDYPMSSSLALEYNIGWSRAKTVLAIFSCGSLGAFSAAIVYMILLAGFKSAIESNLWYLQWVWRLLLGFGLVPCAATIYARLRIAETRPYEKYVAKDHRGLGDQWREFREYFSNWKHARTLFAVSAIWFLFDIAFYGVNLNQSTILSNLGFGAGDTVWETLFNTAKGNLIQVIAGYMPGYWLGIFLPDLIGRVRHQLLGCAIVSILYAVWAGVQSHTGTGGLFALFVISQFTLNAGAASSTFLIPVEVFPTRVRATAHGIAAASGKAGAVLTSFAFGTATQAIGFSGILGLFAGVMAVCTALTLLIPETRGKSIEEIEQGAMYNYSNSEDF
ncbi:uncharacterized protein E0L32_000681 [Thyridium curvatum]|uniref:Major facilitator superfamily (MFS) profile domain-containing protein n=1 Tax=Thyridium curvatum TaxID=1093900 RepID=A0A507B1B4_9PEZI|nr:uncharacterized protein E0L32_000681 [Thyridium curvatum]TPX12504.1 hypothetical protein E0L32_000681 [Thyridium curvatum]